MVINTGPNDGHPRSCRAAQNLRLARHWIVLLQHPLHPTALPSLSCPFLTPDLLRQGRLAGILCSPRSTAYLDAPWPGSGPSLGVWRWRSRDGVQAKQTWRSSNVATEPGQHSPPPLSQGEVWFPINSILLALTFSSSGSDILFPLCVLGRSVCDCAAFFARQ